MKYTILLGTLNIPTGEFQEVKLEYRNLTIDQVTAIIDATEYEKIMVTCYDSSDQLVENIHCEKFSHEISVTSRFNNYTPLASYLISPKRALIVKQTEQQLQITYILLHKYLVK